MPARETQAMKRLASCNYSLLSGLFLLLFGLVCSACFGQEPHLNIPPSRVLKMTPDQFQNYCAERKIHYRVALRVYGRCLHNRNASTIRKLSSARWKKIHRLQERMKRWQVAFAIWRNLIVGDTTMWFTVGLEADIFYEQAIYRLIAPTRTRKGKISWSRRLDAEFRSIWSDLERAKNARLNQSGTRDTSEARKEYPSALAQIKKATQSLHKATRNLSDTDKQAIDVYLVKAQHVLGFE